YHDQLFEHLMSMLDSIPSLTVIGRASTRIPTVSFTLAGMQAEKVAAKLADNRIGTVSGVHGGSRLLDALGVNDEGGAVTIGLAPYTTKFEIDQLGRALLALE
ncbi:aminotransferase class V-fold PLP-dependent enzyme, partial [Nocardia asiatica]